MLVPRLHRFGMLYIGTWSAFAVNLRNASRYKVMKTARQTETFNASNLGRYTLLVVAVAHLLYKWVIATHQHIRGTQTTRFAFGEQHVAVNKQMVAVTIMSTQAGEQHGSADLPVGFDCSTSGNVANELNTNLSSLGWLGFLNASSGSSTTDCTRSPPRDSVR
jgi:hypothetical protein